MKRKKTIVHNGEIVAIEDALLKVRVLQASACSTCSAAQLCKSAESKEKIMMINVTDSHSFIVGEKVMLYIDVGQGLQASFLAYVLPLLLIVGVLAGVSLCNGSDAFAALGCVLVLVVYYTLLYLLRKSLSRKFEIKVIKP